MTEEEFVAFAKEAKLDSEQELCLRAHLGLEYNQDEWAKFKSQPEVFQRRILWSALAKLPEKKESPSA
ncbi:TPA: hypothetical protein DGT35_02090 [Patescibacteria group bacterium]|nr:hypothetical protein [Patescibacteria group bacterium]|tara:strand:+ start:7393 stop:7596 length:204 start_codon:yes stop_codon:yes gene_type:complete